MNVFNLAGPQFLEFYAFLALAVNVLLRFIIASGGPDAKGSVNVSDPYQVACLRDGPRESIRVAVTSLIDRGLLKVEGILIRAADSQAVLRVKRPIEKAILERCAEAVSPGDLYKDPATRDEGNHYENELTACGYIAGPGELDRRQFHMKWACLVLGGVASAKIGIALARGHTNVVFLVFLAIVGVGFAMGANRGRLSSVGENTLSGLRDLHEKLRERADQLKPGGRTSELAMLAGVFGLGAVPIVIFPYVREMFPMEASSSASLLSIGDSGCGSSCGSSCGGGCGGGCGGCGS